jgi:hypothetical protein
MQAATLDLTIDGNLETASVPGSFQDIYDSVSDAANNNNLDDLESVWTAFGIGNAYNDDSQVNAVLNAQDLDATISSPTDSTQITLQIPSANINETFDGATRDESMRKLVDYLEDHISDLYSAVQTDTSAGILNGAPSSFSNNVANDSWSMAGGGAFDPSGGVGDAQDTASFAARFSTYTVSGNNVDAYSLPLGYTFNLENGFGLITSLPLTYVRTEFEDSTVIESLQASLGLGLRIPLNHLVGLDNRWDLTPLFRVGAAGSVDDYTQAVVLYSPGLLSEYYFELFDLDFSIRNMVNYYTAVSILDYAGISVGNIENWLFKNGIRVATPISIPGVGDSLFGRQLAASLWFNDTRVAGENLYVNNYQEIGFDIGLLAKKSASESSTVSKMVTENELRFGMTYTHASEIDEAFSANFGFSF